MVENVGERRLNIEDVKKVKFGALRKTVEWWWKRYQKNAKGNVEKLWNNMYVTYWRHNLK